SLAESRALDAGDDLSRRYAHGTCPDLGAPVRCGRRRGCPGHLLHMREVTWVRMVDWAQCVPKLVTSATISWSSKIWRPWRVSSRAGVPRRRQNRGLTSP